MTAPRPAAPPAADYRPPIPAPLRVIADRLRAIPRDNPGWETDALLQAAAALNECSICLETYHTGASDGVRQVIEALRALAYRATALAPVFAPPAQAPAARPPQQEHPGS